MFPSLPAFSLLLMSVWTSAPASPSQPPAQVSSVIVAVTDWCVSAWERPGHQPCHVRSPSLRLCQEREEGVLAMRASGTHTILLHRGLFLSSHPSWGLTPILHVGWWMRPWQGARLPSPDSPVCIIPHPGHWGSSWLNLLYRKGCLNAWLLLNKGLISKTSSIWFL